MEERRRRQKAPQTRPLVEDQEFEGAFSANFRPIHRFLARRVGSTLADDLTAETFAIAFRRRDSFDLSASCRLG